LLGRAILQGGRWLPILVGAALMLAAASVVLPALIGRATDAALGRTSSGWLVWLFVVVGITAACDALEDLAAGATTARSTAWLRGLLFGHVMAVGTPAVDGLGAGDISNRLTGNAADAGRVAQDVVRAVANGLPSVGGTVALGIIDPWLLVTFASGLPVLAFFVRTFARSSFDVAESYLAAQAGIVSRLVDALAGSRTIAASGTVEREADRVLGGLPELHRQGMRMWRTQIRMSAQDTVVVSLLEVAVLAVAGLELSRGRISPGGLLAAGQYVLLAATLGHSSSSLGRMGRDRAAARRLCEVLRMPRREYGTQRLCRGYGRLDFDQVSVYRGGRFLLDRVDLTIPPGSFVALVGKSGSGKSTFAEVAGRMIDPDEGQVSLDGVALGSLSRSELRRAITYGFDRPCLIGKTVSDTIALGVSRPGDEAIRAAAKAARADGFIARLPLGFDTPVREAPMSGGERQRIGLARAFLNAGRVLILDDVAASLDTVTEHEISNVLSNELSDRTRLVVAHRASTAARADFVVWLQEGRVRAVRPHDELWSEATYRALFGELGDGGRASSADDVAASFS
jgi:ATP-binding cassette subfamily B protein